MKRFILQFLITLVFYSSYAFQTSDEIRKVDGKNYVVYKVQKGDTWYAIARKFTVSYAELRVANKGADDKLVTGKELLIPEKLKPNDPYFQKNQLDSKSETKTTEKYHVVQSSQTLYSIAKTYNVSVDNVKEWNHLTSNEISVGQKLIVGKPAATVAEPVKQVAVISTEPVAPTPPSEPAVIENKENNNTKTVEETPAVKKDTNQIDTSLVTSKVEDMESPVETKKAEQPEPTTNDKSGEVVFSNGMQQVNETGTASWMDEEGGNSDKYYALHRTAKTGTVIRVMNLANSKKIYVKVTGQMPDDAENDGVLIKLSKASAEKLGITEKTARVNLLYGAGAE